MQVNENFVKSTLYITLIGDMDEYSSNQVRHKCDKLIDANPTIKQVIFNLSQVTFMDSTGIGFLIGRYKKATRLGIAMFVENPNLAADKVLNLSGIYSLIPKTD